MRKRTKIRKKCNGTVRRQDEEKLQDVEKLILQSHKDEQSYDEAVAVNKIRKDPLLTNGRHGGIISTALKLRQGAS